ncbi:blast:ATP-binding cassette sub-family A member 3 [Drosophila guanche]|uniref:Blast:ATP-binding cassette sub-family A member 3 n=1 Tax=Drosophila guanche TaxID=7266 RepID=A0A3B0JEC6_DROGU|nr:blast:ATP-binding cassette sub-family A member 3 [Drosophila guanche]
MSQSAKVSYYRISGFLILQTEISLKYLQKKNSTHTFVRPKLELLYDQYIFMIFFKASGVLLMLLFLFPFTMDVKSIVEEKELQLKDLLNISDVSNSLQWLACNWCAIIAIILFIASSLPNYVTDKDNTGTLLNILCSIFVVSAMSMVMDRIVVWEDAGLGLQWSNLFETSLFPVRPSDEERPSDNSSDRKTSKYVDARAKEKRLLLWFKCGWSLRFYSRLRGLKGAAVKQEVNKYLQKLNLKEKAGTSARRLSGGTQRRLALACALCGHVKVLFCDEPSTGLYPSSRHDLWKLLLDEKRGRTILLTTHHMDEGEVLADRIAIISDGRLRCLGTLAFLKKQNETSYLLTCEKGPNCNVSRLTQLIASHVPITRPHSNIGSDVSYRLPHRFLGSFGSLFNDLEQQQDQLDVVGFGLSSTSLTEIFMSHGAEDLGGGGGRGRTSSGGGGGGSDQQRPVQSQSQSQRQSQEQSRYLNLFQRYLAQCEAMMLKKLLHIYDTNPLLSRLPITLADYKSDDVRVILQSTSDTRPARDIANAYQELAKQHCTVQRLSQNFKDFVGPSVQDTPARLYEMKRRLLAAATFDKETIVWCRSLHFIHSDPLSLNLAFNAMAKAMVGPEASIEVTNAPYEKSSSLEQNLTVYVTVCMCIMIYLAIVLPIFAISVVQEKVSQIRMQQQVSGVNLATYWLTHYIVDLTLYFVFSLALTLAVHDLCNPWDMLSILMIIGAAGLPFTYILACCFRSAGSALAVIINIHIIVGSIFNVSFQTETFKCNSTRFSFSRRVSKMSSADRKEQALVLNNVSKRFCTFSAVGGISFAVKPGWSLQFRPRAARKQLGYCPQHDTLFDFCTGRQTLRIFLLLRGTRRNLLREMSEKLATDLGFLAHLDKKVKAYSGGTKRKLNAAVAAEGSSLLCLDEPSSGVDPASRRHVWTVLSSLRDKGKAVLLSSHSMEEVEALCSQLEIIVDGKIHCLGSQQRIKNKFAESLVLKLHVETGNLESLAYTVEKVKNQMASDFPKSSLQEEFGGRLTYHIPTAKLRWSRVFSYVERNRSPWKLLDYSLSQPSVEDVFLDIAKKSAQEKTQQNIQNSQPKSRPTKKESAKSSKDNGRATRLTKP